MINWKLAKWSGKYFTAKKLPIKLKLLNERELESMKTELFTMKIQTTATTSEMKLEKKRPRCSRVKRNSTRAERKKENTLCESFCSIALVWCIQHSSVIGRCYSCCCHRLNGWCVVSSGFFLFLSLARFHLSFCCSRYCCCCCAVTMCVYECVISSQKAIALITFNETRSYTDFGVCVCECVFKRAELLSCCFLFLDSSHHHCSACTHGPLLLRCALQIASDRS